MIRCESSVKGLWIVHPFCQGPLDRWFNHARKASWSNFAAVRSDYSHADFVGPFVVFNMSDNKYWLIARIDFEHYRVYVRDILTHQDYDIGTMGIQRRGKMAAVTAEDRDLDFELVKEFPLRQIQSDSDRDQAIEILWRLLDFAPDARRAVK